MKTNLPGSPAVRWSCVAVASLLLSLLFQMSGSDPEGAALPAKPLSIDTEIPRGHVLIPITIANYEALDSILGSTGKVDLYVRPPESMGIRPVVRGIRILRAPQSDSHFAVLAPEFEAPQILKHVGAFYVAVQGPHRAGTDFVNPTSFKPKVRSIIIETDGDQ